VGKRAMRGITYPLEKGGFEGEEGYYILVGFVNL
jgi:hypothetical protein